MLNLLSVGIENSIPSGGRCFSLEVGRDLFGAWSITTRQGLKFSSGRTKRYVEEDKSLAQERVRKILSRTLSKPTSSDATFRYIDVSEDENIFSWVPAEKCPLSAISARH